MYAYVHGFEVERHHTQSLDVSVLCQLMAGGAEGFALRSSRTACLFQVTAEIKCVFVTLGLDFLDGGVSKHWNNLFRWYKRSEWSSASTLTAAVF